MMNLLTLFLIAAGSLPSAPQMVLDVPKEPPAVPASRPEARHRVPVPPLTILGNLSSADEAARRMAYQQLGKNSGDPVDSARLLMVNLDDDDDLEAVLLYTTARKVTAAAIFDKGPDGWWEIGEFQSTSRWDAGDAERLIELQEIVWPGRKDIVVHLHSATTGDPVGLAVYRVYKGQLYRVFKSNEDPEAAGIARSLVTLYAPGADGRSAIVVRGTRTVLPASSSTRPGCVAYGWDAATFSFLPDHALTTGLCDGGTERPAIITAPSLM
jgi:hypothetical protein